MEKHIARQQYQKESWNGYTNIRKNSLSRKSLEETKDCILLRGSIHQEDTKIINTYKI